MRRTHTGARTEQSRGILWLIMICFRWLLLASLLWRHGEGQMERAPRPLFQPLELSQVSVVITMICRNEAVNFRSNLRLWFPVVDYFVFMMDSRNTDDSEEVIGSIMEEGKKQYIIDKHDFTGFGQARTKSLDTAWLHFSKATHVIIADPDWRPRINTLDINQLIAANAEVFRFTVYDRNRITTRRIDWMLRHRQGLSMRYHLHEVLDIGFYTWTDTTWEVDEIEQKGTWHNEVGHANSFSANRYKFDLDMLAKDKNMYHNDPHVDYYLGITHSSYAEKLLKVPGIDVDNLEIQSHYDRAVHHLKLRATAQYAEEFSEQRWGSMLTLAAAYEQPRWHGHDRQEAIKWYKLCTDFSPRQFECAAQLINLYLNAGLSVNAVEEAWLLARTEPEPRVMLNTRGGFDCTLPEVLVTVFVSHLAALISRGGDTPVAGLSQYSKYVLALANQVLSGSECPASQKAHLRSTMATRVNLNAIHQALAVDEVANSVQFLEDDLLLVDLPALCQDQSLREYLLANELFVHPCGDIQPSRQCKDFTAAFPGVAEDKQMSLFGEYIGAASLIDVIHQVHLGDGFRTVPSGRTFHVLFAEHFNPRLLYKLIAFAEVHMGNRLHLTVVHPDEALLQSILDTVSECGHAQTVQVEFIAAPILAEWVSIYADAVWKDVDEGREPVKGFFDYIEYNGALSTSTDLARELALFKDILNPDGVLGASYFTSNNLQASLFDLVSARNSTANLAFSSEVRRLVRAYLEHRGLRAHARDPALVDFFSRTGGEKEPRRVYNGAAIEQVTASHGYDIASMLPTSTSRPFSEAPEYYQVAKHKEFGASEDSFLHHFGSALRQVVYLTPSGGHDRPKGRATPQRVMAYAGEEFQTIDRVGTLGATFGAEMVQTALNNDYPVVYGTTNAPPLPFNLSFVIPSSILPALPLLRHSPFMHTMIDECEGFWNNSEQTLPLPASLDRLRQHIVGDMLSFLGFMERIDLLSFVHHLEGAQYPRTELRGHRTGDPRPSKRILSTAEESESSPLALGDDIKEMRSSTSAVSDLASKMAADLEKLRGISGILSSMGDEPPSSSADTEEGSDPPAYSVLQDQDHEVRRGLQSPDVKRPKQTLPALHASHRRAECSTEGKWRNQDCRVDRELNGLGIPERISSTPSLVCRRKIMFDHMQMRYIAKKKPQLEEYIRTDGLPGIEVAAQMVEKVLIEANVSDPSSCLRLNDPSMDALGGAFNRIFFVSREPMLGAGMALLQSPAVEQLATAIASLRSGTVDAITVDNVLTETVLAAASSALMLSTIYFDLTNGQTFVSHDDDGLAFGVFAKISSELSQALPGTKVKKCFALAMDLRQSGISPILMAGKGEALLVLWLTPTSLDLNAAKEREGQSDSDGLLLFHHSASAALHDSEYNVSFHQHLHTEFLTTDMPGHFPFDHPYPDSSFGPKSVKRNVNRAALIASEHPFYFVNEVGREKGSLDDDAVHALVITLGIVTDAS